MQLKMQFFVPVAMHLQAASLPVFTSARRSNGHGTDLATTMMLEVYWKESEVCVCIDNGRRSWTEDKAKPGCEVHAL